MLNEFQTKLYNDLKHLVETNEAFLSKIQTLDNVEYIVFNYRLATYSDFLLPNARESRGIMFELDENKQPIRLACFMPSKFFNYGEGDTLKLDISDSNIDGVMDKLDGSIISTFMHKGKLTLKSKTSLHSEHVASATVWLNLEPILRSALAVVTEAGYSVHMELMSPVLSIVVIYPEISLRILSMREIATGKMVSLRDVKRLFSDVEMAISSTETCSVAQVLEDNWVYDVIPEHLVMDAYYLEGIEVTNVKDFIACVKDMKGVEGIIVRLKCGEHLKIKCDWYCALHHTKDSVSSPRRLFECVLNEGADDLKGMFAADPGTMLRITEMENKVISKMRSIVATVEIFHHTHKHLTRKDYAIAAAAVGDDLMSLKMNMYTGKENDYKVFALKHMELFDIHPAEKYELVEE